MEKRKNLKFTLMGLGFLILLSAFTIQAHVLMVKKENKNKIPYQLSRIDIQTKLNQREAIALQTNVLKMKGVQNAIFNNEDGILVFIHNKDIVQSSGIYNELMKSGQLKASQFITKNSPNQGGCPVVVSDNFSFKSLYLSLFHNK